MYSMLLVRTFRCSVKHPISSMARPRAADFSQDLQQELSTAGRRRSAMAAQGAFSGKGMGSPWIGSTWNALI